MAGIRVMCVDPDPDARGELVDRLRADLEDPDLTAHASMADATAALDGGVVDCLVTEYDLPDGTGLDLAARLREAAPDASVVLFTAHPHDDIDTGERDDVVVEYVDKGAGGANVRVASLIELTVTARSQVSYPVPDAEEGRLSAVEEYDFDSPAVVASLDRVTDLATRHFGVETASVNVIEEHEQKLLACQGLDVRSTSREGSICTFTIVSDDRVMAVEDVREDPRFESRHGEFEGLGIRAYMGAQLVTSSGFSVGTLCVYDDEPRSFSAADRAYLERLAEVAVDLLSLHARVEVGHGPDTDGADDEADDDISAAGEAFR